MKNHVSDFSYLSYWSPEITIQLKKNCSEVGKFIGHENVTDSSNFICYESRILPAEWKILHELSERLASLSIMGAQLRTLFKSLLTIVLLYSCGSKGALNWAPMMPRNISLSGNYTSDRCYFPSLPSCFCMQAESFPLRERKRPPCSRLMTIFGIRDFFFLFLTHTFR